MFELLKIEDVLKHYADRVEVILVTSALSALDRLREGYKAELNDLLSRIDHQIVQFRSVGQLLQIYANGGLSFRRAFWIIRIIWGHGMEANAWYGTYGRFAVGSPVPSYHDVCRRTEGQGIRICETEAEWSDVFDGVLGGRIRYDEEGCVWELKGVEEDIIRPDTVAMEHAAFVRECVGGYTGRFVLTMKVAFLYNKGRLSRLPLIEQKKCPTEFFYSAVELAEGWA